MTKVLNYSKFGDSEIGYWSLFGYWNLVTGYCRICDAVQAPNFFNFSPFANIRATMSTAGNRPSCPFWH